MRGRRPATMLAAVVTLAGCGGGAPARTTPPRPATTAPTVAALGDSITAGSPLWDPDPQVRAQLGAQLNEQSQYEYWAEARLHIGFRNCGVFGERTDQIALRLDRCAAGARVLIVQGGINDIAQGRSVQEAARSLDGMVRRGQQLGLRVVLVQVLPWNNGGQAAAPLIRRLNALIGQLGARRQVPVLPFYGTLEDPRNPGQMAAALTIDGNHPSVAGYQRLGALIQPAQVSSGAR